MEEKNYPTIIEYLKRREFQELLETYEHMDASHFLHTFPNPKEFFSNWDRACSSQYNTNLSTFLTVLFPEAGEDVLQAALDSGKNLLLPSVNYLKAAGCEQGPFPSYSIFPSNQPLDLSFIQELTYLRLQDEIENAKEVGEIEKKCRTDEAKAAGTLFECPVCCDEEVLLMETRACGAEASHMFCKDCVAKHAEVSAIEGRPKVTCLEQGCQGFFSLAQISGLLTPALFARLLREVQQSELREAEVEGLEECPFCSFPVAIEDPGLAVFKCPNPLCMIDTCRKCKRPDHGTVQCHLVEDDNQVKARVLLEEKLTSAIVRSCPRCKKEVVKEEGCNLMSCGCGAKFCYACRQEVDGYGHFDRGRCQTWIVAEEIHRVDLTRAVEEGRSEVARNFGDVTLVHDPTKDLEL